MAKFFLEIHRFIESYKNLWMICLGYKHIAIFDFYLVARGSYHTFYEITFFWANTRAKYHYITTKRIGKMITHLIDQDKFAITISLSFRSSIGDSSSVKC